MHEMPIAAAAMEIAVRYDMAFPFLLLLDMAKTTAHWHNKASILKLPVS
jgi:hypothetical protein